MRTPGLMDGYVADPDATADAIDEDGWLHTGDLGSLADGTLFVTGRIKDVIIAGGHNLMPAPIEEIAGSVDGVRAGCVAAVGVPSEQRATERVVVVAETKADVAEHPAISRRVREALRLRGIAVDRIVLVGPGEIPRTTSGKVRRREVARTLALGHALMGEMKERMLRGELYIADDPELIADNARAQELLDRYNATLDGEQDERDRAAARAAGRRRRGRRRQAELSLRLRHVHHDRRRHVRQLRLRSARRRADRDRGGVPARAARAAADRDPSGRSRPRRAGWESAAPIALGDNVWLGGGVIVGPGVTIGEDTVVGAGSVVTRDLPAGVVAFGVPARVHREIGERDRVDVPDRAVTVRFAEPRSATGSCASSPKPTSTTSRRCSSAAATTTSCTTADRRSRPGARRVGCDPGRTPRSAKHLLGLFAPHLRPRRGRARLAAPRDVEHRAAAPRPAARGARRGESRGGRRWLGDRRGSARCASRCARQHRRNGVLAAAGLRAGPGRRRASDRDRVRTPRRARG